MKIVFTGLRKVGNIDLEAVEGATRAAVHRAGAAVLAHLLDEQEAFPAALPCGCGHQASFHAIRPRQLLTAVGPVAFDRAYYYVRIAIRVRFRVIGNWISWIPITPQRCAA